MVCGVRNDASLRCALANRKQSKTMTRSIVTVDPGDYAAIDRLAQQSEITASWLFRRSMREFLERHEHQGFLSLLFGQARWRTAGSG